MDLLEETDWPMGYAGSSYMIGDYDDDNNEEEDEKYEEEAGEHSCSMCLVKHKGAPSVPCRHSFCKLCSKEIWVGMGVDTPKLETVALFESATFLFEVHHLLQLNKRK